MPANINVNSRSIQRWFARYIEDRSFKYWFYWALIVKTIVLLVVCGANYFLFHSSRTFLNGGDTFSYVNPIENLLAKGVYAENVNYLPSYAGRMPAVGAIYGLFRFFFDMQTAKICYCIVQILASYLVVYLIGKIAYFYRAKNYIAGLAMFLYASNTFLLKYEVVVLSESLAISTAVFSLYYLVEYIKNRNNNLNLFWSGVMLAISIFFRPVNIGVYALMGGYVMFLHIKEHNSVMILLKKAIIFSVFFIVLDVVWVVRNYGHYHKIVPLQQMYAGYTFQESYKALLTFNNSLGYDPSEWEAESSMNWFMMPEKSTFVWQQDDFTKEYGLAEMQSVRAEFLTIPVSSKQSAQDSARDVALATRIRGYQESFKQQYTFRYYVVNNLKKLNILAFKNGGTALFDKRFSELPVVLKLFKLASVVLYLLIVFGGFVYIVFWWNKNNMLLKIMPLYTVLIFVIIVSHPEHRYFALAYPFMILNFVLLIDAGLGLLQRYFQVDLPPKAPPVQPV